MIGDASNAWSLFDARIDLMLFPEEQNSFAKAQGIDFQSIKRSFSDDRRAVYQTGGLADRGFGSIELSMLEIERARDLCTR